MAATQLIVNWIGGKKNDKKIDDKVPLWIIPLCPFAYFTVIYKLIDYEEKQRKLRGKYAGSAIYR